MVEPDLQDTPHALKKTLAAVIPKENINERARLLLEILSQDAECQYKAEEKARNVLEAFGIELNTDNQNKVLYEAARRWVQLSSQSIPSVEAGTAHQSMTPAEVCLALDIVLHSIRPTHLKAIHPAGIVARGDQSVGSR